MAVLVPSRFQAFNNEGNFLVDGRLYFFLAGTDTPADVYTDAGGGTSHPHPIVLDARGEASVWLDPAISYKRVLRTYLDAVLYTEDNVQAPNAGNMTYLPSGTDAVATTVSDELDRHIVSSLRFMSEVQRNDVLGRVGSVDVNAPLQKWIDYCATNGCTGDWVSGIYLNGATLTVSSDNVYLIGRGLNTRVRRTGDYGHTLVFTGNDTTGDVIENCGLFDVTFDSDAIMTNGAHVWLNAVFQFRGSNLFALDGFMGFRISGARQAYLHNLQSNHNNIYGGSATDRIGVLFDAAAATHSHPSCADTFITGCNVKVALPGSALIDHCIKITSADGIWINDGHTGGAGISNICLSAEDASNAVGTVNMDGVMSDSGYGAGYHFKGNSETIFNTKISNCHVHGFGGVSPDTHGFYIESGTDIEDGEFTDIAIYTHGQNGARILSGEGLTFSGLVVRGNSREAAGTWAGIYMENATDVRFSGGASGFDFPRSGNRWHTYGIEFGAGNSDITLDGIDLQGNVSGSISGGAGQYRWSGGALDRAAAAAENSNLVKAGGANFNGTTSYLDTNALTGIGDSKKGTLAWKGRFAAAAGALETIIATTGQSFVVRRDANGNLTFVGLNAAAATIMAQSVSDAFDSAGVYTVLASWDLAVAGSMKIWINDADATVSSITFTDDSVDLTVTEFSVGASVAGANFFAGDMYLIGFDETVALDFDDVAVRRRFFDRAGNIANLGINGATAFGVQPRLLLWGRDYTEWPTNLGSGTGTFTVNGAAATTAVPDYTYPEGIVTEFTVTGASHTIGNTTTSIIGDRAAGTITVTMEAASAANKGKRRRFRTVQNQAIVSASSNIVPLTGGAAGTAICAATSGKWAEVESNGTTWQIIAGN